MHVHEGQLEPFDKHLLERAKTQWQFGDWESLAELTLDRLTNHPQRARLALLAASGQAQCGDLEEAKASVRQAEAWGANRNQMARALASGVYNALGKAAAVAGQPERALPLFRMALTVAGPAHEVRLSTGVRIRQQLAQLGFVNSEAMSDWPEAAQLPGFQSDRPSVQQFLKAKLTQVAEYRAEGNYAVGEAILQEVLHEQPGNIAALKELGALKSKQQDWEQAAEAYGQLLNTQTTAIQAILARARVRCDADQLDEAIAELQRAKSLGFDTAALNHQLAVTYRDNRQLAESEQLIRDVLRTDPSYARELRFATFAADVLRKRKHVREALKLLKSAVDFATEQDKEVHSNTKAVLLELRQAVADATEKIEVSKSFYDTVYADSKEYENDPEHSVYLPTWEKVLHELKMQGVLRVFDIGCGPGQFAQYLLERMPGLVYHGVDYSQTAIFKAQRRCPSARFSEADVLNEDVFSGVDADVYIILEVLEHIEQDCKLLTRIPAGKQVILSVPNFDSFGHVRFFKDKDEVLARYGELFGGLRVQTVELTGRSKIFLATGDRHPSIEDFKNSAENP